VRRAWSEVFQVLNENNLNTSILYPTKLSSKIDGIIKVFHDNQKLTQYMTTKPSLQKILQGICSQNMKAKKPMKGHIVSNNRRRKGMKEE
jgi:hypothetical protein